MQMSSSKTSATTPKKRVLVIPAAGSGQRFRELGKKYPKCILPVSGTPIIAHIVGSFTESYDHPIFDQVVISTGSAEHKEQIEGALASSKFNTPVSVVLVDVPTTVKPSPAISLAAACSEALSILGEDCDVTVFLSDMLPLCTHTVYQVVAMPTDTWGVVPKDDNDFARWCMVKREPGHGLMFFDKPETKPDTDLAAVGVYRYSSACDIVMAVEQLLGFGNGIIPERWTKEEMQFSHLAIVYQRAFNHALTLHEYEADEFRDFGTLEEYLANKGLSRCRSFNRIVDNGRTITKLSKQYTKIRDEAVWMLHAPHQIASYIPRVIRSDLQNGTVEMQKIRSNNLRDVALYLDNSYETWVEIFQNIDGYLQATRATKVSYEFNTEFWDAMERKTQQRADGLVGTAHQDWLKNEFPKVIKILRAKGSADPVVYYHGDLHFANMFYCFTYKDLHVIDPRGEMRGSSFYDIAKLAHTAIGRYDYIDADMYVMGANGAEFYDAGHENITRAFHDVILKDWTADEIWLLYQIVASLFLSMIPLHADNRQHQQLFYREFERFVKMAQSFTPIGV